MVFNIKTKRNEQPKVIEKKGWSKTQLCSCLIFDCCCQIMSCAVNVVVNESHLGILRKFLVPNVFTKAAQMFSDLLAILKNMKFKVFTLARFTQQDSSFYKIRNASSYCVRHINMNAGLSENCYEYFLPTLSKNWPTFIPTSGKNVIKSTVSFCLFFRYFNNNFTEKMQTLAGFELGSSEQKAFTLTA